MSEKKEPIAFDGNNADFIDTEGLENNDNKIIDDGLGEYEEDDDLEEVELLDDNEEEEENSEEENKEENKETVSDDDILDTLSYINDSLNLDIEISKAKELGLKGNEILEAFVNTIKDSAIEEYLQSNTEQKPEYKTDIAKRIDELVSSGVDVDSALAEYNSKAFELKNLENNLLSYDKYDLVGNYLMTKYGFSEEKAQETLDMYDAKEIIDVEYEKVLGAYKKEIEQEKSKIREQVFQDKLKKEQEKLESERVQIEKDRKEISEMLSKTNTFGGLTLSDNDKKGIYDFLFVPDKQGNTEFEKVLQSNKHLLEIGILFKKHQDIFNYLKTSSKEEGKKGLFNKLSTNPLETPVKTSVNQDTGKKKKLNEF
jgi:hypothetical protein